MKRSNQQCMRIKDLSVGYNEGDVLLELEDIRVIPISRGEMFIAKFKDVVDQDRNKEEIIDQIDGVSFNKSLELGKILKKGGIYRISDFMVEEYKNKLQIKPLLPCDIRDESHQTGSRPKKVCISKSTKTEHDKIVETIAVFSKRDNKISIYDGSYFRHFSVTGRKDYDLEDGLVYELSNTYYSGDGNYKTLRLPDKIKKFVSYKPLTSIKSVMEKGGGHMVNLECKVIFCGDWCNEIRNNFPIYNEDVPLRMDMITDEGLLGKWVINRDYPSVRINYQKFVLLDKEGYTIEGIRYTRGSFGGDDVSGFVGSLRKISFLKSIKVGERIMLEECILTRYTGVIEDKKTEEMMETCYRKNFSLVDALVNENTIISIRGLEDGIRGESKYCYDEFVVEGGCGGSELFISYCPHDKEKTHNVVQRCGENPKHLQKSGKSRNPKSEKTKTAPKMDMGDYWFCESCKCVISKPLLSYNFQFNIRSCITDYCHLVNFEGSAGSELFGMSAKKMDQVKLSGYDELGKCLQKRLYNGKEGIVFYGLFEISSPSSTTNNDGSEDDNNDNKQTRRVKALSVYKQRAKVL